MNVSLYQAAAAMNANMRWQEAIADNLGISSLPGARRKDVSFSSVQAAASGVASASGSSDSGIVMPSANVSMNFVQGTQRPTGNSTDLAIEGPGFLEVQMPDGTRAYTRDGELQKNAKGQLVTKLGYTVLGDGAPVQLDSSNSGTLTISASGQVTQGSEVKGRIKLVEFNDRNLLQSIGGGCFAANDSKLLASPAQSSELRQGFVEETNVSPTSEMASLLTAMRMFESNQKVLQMQDERMGKVISDLGNPS